MGDNENVCNDTFSENWFLGLSIGCRGGFPLEWTEQSSNQPASHTSTTIILSRAFVRPAAREIYANGCHRGTCVFSANRKMAKLPVYLSP